MSKVARRVFYIILIAVVLFFGGKAFVFWKMKTTIVSKIEELKTKGFDINYSSIEANSFSGSLTIKGLEVDRSQNDSICSTTATVDELNVTGISILSFITQKKLSISSINVVRPWIQYSRQKKSKDRQSREPVSKRSKVPLKEIEVGAIRIDSGKFQIVDSASCSIALKARFSFDLQDLSADKLDSDSLHWITESFAFTGIEIDMASKFYNAKINEVKYSRTDRSMEIDSLRLSPTLARNEFAKQAGDQVDQFTALVPFIRMKDFAMTESIDPSFVARQIDLQLFMDVYRDKRYARKPRKAKVLPITFLNRISFPVKIDSVVLSPSRIVYEERPEKNDGVGKISFHELKAGIYNISNSDSVGEARMNVYSRFMNSGNLSAQFSFPYEKRKLYSVKGSLTGLPMKDLNSMLEPAALIKIESGKLQAMNFNFSYDSYKSNGQLELRYSDLEVVAIKNEDKSVNKVVSFIIKALLKKNIDKSDPLDKRTGTISWERDTQKAILNYWWKSIFTGVKSVFGFENPLAKKDKKK